MPKPGPEKRAQGLAPAAGRAWPRRDLGPSRASQRPPRASLTALEGLQTALFSAFFFAKQKKSSKNANPAEKRAKFDLI